MIQIMNQGQTIEMHSKKNLPSNQADKAFTNI